MRSELSSLDRSTSVHMPSLWSLLNDRLEDLQKMCQDEPTYIWGREVQRAAGEMWHSGGMLPLDYVKRSHSSEVAALLWKLKASQRFTAFVRRGLSHSVSGPAPTRYTLHGRLLWTTPITTSAAGRTICLCEEEEVGLEEGWGAVKKSWAERVFLCWFKLAVTDEIWLCEPCTCRF